MPSFVTMKPSQMMIQCIGKACHSHKLLTSQYVFYANDCAYSKDSNQSAHYHTHNLIRVLVLRLKKGWALGYP